jgi:hypothetical protein
VYTNAKNRFWQMFFMVAREPAGTGDSPQVSFDQRDPRALDHDVGSRAHGDPGLSFRESRCVVDPVSGRRHDPPFGLHPPDGIGLPGGQHRGDDLVQAELLADGGAGVTASPVIIATQVPSRCRRSWPPGSRP